MNGRVGPKELQRYGEAVEQDPPRPPHPVGDPFPGGPSAFFCAVALPQLGSVLAVHQSPTHSFSKQERRSIHLLAGIGVQGDAHAGVTVRHRSRVRQDPTQPNLRQVHLIHAELFDELRGKGFVVTPGLIGENITTWGIDLLGLPRGARLHIGPQAIVEVTGLRNPCSQLNDLLPGLMNAVLDRDREGGLVRKSGIMGIVIAGGEVRAGDRIQARLPTPPWERLERV